MSKNEKVYVACPYETLFHTGKKVHATRLRVLGLTAYADTHEESVKKLKEMLNTFVKAHRKLGTLEERLNESGLYWCWQSEYKGSGKTQNAEGCEVQLSNTWKAMGELAIV